MTKLSNVLPNYKQKEQKVEIGAQKDTQSHNALWAIFSFHDTAKQNGYTNMERKSRTVDTETFFIIASGCIWL